VPQRAKFFFDRISDFLSPTELSRVNAAWLLAMSAHTGQLRQSGESYDTHPLAVATLLFEFVGADADALCAALLHDVVEDTDTTLASITAEFGERVARVVDGVSKLDRLPVAHRSTSNASDDTLRKLVASGGRDWRVFAVKLCDRLHNMRTLASVGRAKQRRVANETRLVYVPLANYVGFAQLATELKALSLYWTYPWRWAVIEKWIRYKDAVDRARVQNAVNHADLNSSDLGPADLERANNEMMVRGFDLLRENRACRSLFALPRLYRSCDSMDGAYERCARLHRDFVLLPASFSCHSFEGVVGSKVALRAQGLIVECVFFFPRIARPLADAGLGDGDDFAAMAAATEHPGEFTRVLRDLVESASIAVFSPAGRCLSLPRRASGLDFAFAIHTDIGLRASAVRINGHLRDVQTELSSGDVVEVVTDDAVLAKPEWEGFLRSPRARSKLRHWLREAGRSNSALLGKRLLHDAAGANSSEGIFATANNDQLLQACGCSTTEELYRKIGSGEISAFAVAALAKGTGAYDVLKTTGDADERSRLELNGVAKDGVDYCELCFPIPGDTVLATSSYSGITIHRVSCSRALDNRASADFFFPVWSTQIAAALPTKLRISCLDRRALLADCARSVANCNVDVIAVKTLSTQRSDTAVATLDFTILVRSAYKLEACIKALKLVPGVREVARMHENAA
jgi:GTP diphosphokinase / guanosine-3',5'-bis(diphosphate) 3'-diphosphatase